MCWYHLFLADGREDALFVNNIHKDRHDYLREASCVSCWVVDWWGVIV